MDNTLKTKTAEPQVRVAQPFDPGSLPPENIDWRALITLIGEANAALARYDGQLRTLVNPNVLISPLFRREAVLSSRIEGTQANLTDVLAYEAGEDRPQHLDDIQEIMNYRAALNTAVDELHERPISLNMMKNAHYVLMNSVRGHDKARGEFRRVQNYIGNAGASIEQATYVPPEPSRVMEHMDKLEHFIHSEQPDKLVQAAMIHAQFEIIHPFLDGNGRVGRLLIPLFMLERELIYTPAFFISAYLEAHRATYYDLLLGITEQGNWQAWIEFFLTAIREQARDDASKASEILTLYDQMKMHIAEVTRSQFAIQAVDFLFTRPIFSTPQLHQETNIKTASASRLVSALLEAGDLRTLQEGRGRSPAIYAFPELLNIIQV